MSPYSTAKIPKRNFFISASVQQELRSEFKIASAHFRPFHSHYFLYSNVKKLHSNSTPDGRRLQSPFCAEKERKAEARNLDVEIPRGNPAETFSSQSAGKSLLTSSRSHISLDDNFTRHLVLLSCSGFSASTQMTVELFVSGTEG